VPDPVPRVVDHVGFAVADYQRSKAFYAHAFAPLGVTLLMEFAGASAGFGKSDRPSFFIEAHGQPVRGRLHLALRAETRAQVDAFYVAAIEAGGTDNGPPGVRAIYHPDYYGAYVLDPDGCLQRSMRTRWLRDAVRAHDAAVVEPERMIAFYQALGFELRRELPIVRDGELEATNYFLGIAGSDEPELELTFNHDGRGYELGTVYGHIALVIDDLTGTLAALAGQVIEPERPPYSVREGGSLLAFVRDPVNGYRVELIEARSE
jgi:lactoylglutathione lyase